MWVFLPCHFARPPRFFAFEFQIESVWNARRAYDKETRAALGNIRNRTHDWRLAVSAMDDRGLIVAGTAEVFPVFQFASLPIQQDGPDWGEPAGAQPAQCPHQKGNAAGLRQE